ncbi:MAG: hypothetical protein L0H23_01045 [Luteimonas sp.]|nr:hypothetical protein [Luteimonas sp.]
MKTLANLLLPALGALAWPAHARQAALELEPPVERPVMGNYVGEPGIAPEMMTAGFLAGHPDVRWRREGLHSYSRKEYDIALDQFLRAARYGDKPAQAMLAEMYWKGIGVAQDKPRGYAWMDLAAERRFPNFVILRERYWGQLGAAARKQAIRVGRPLMDEYGDDSARLRLAKVLRRNQHVATSSRLGFVGNNISGSKPGLFARGLGIAPSTGPLAGSGIYLSADDYYASDNWQVDQYWRRQAAAWGAPPATGTVHVGDVMPLDAATGNPEPPSAAADR